MAESPETTKKSKNAPAILHIPIWEGVAIIILVITFFILTLTPSPMDKALFQTVGMTATQQWADAANPQTAVTGVAPATLTPTSTPTDSATSTPSPTEIPALDVGSFKISDADGMKMLYVPAGSFMMGYESGDPQTIPIHEVYLDAYWIDQTEISNEMYEACVSAGKCSEPDSRRSANRREYYGSPTYYNYPVIYISWFQAKEYCEWAGRQLPTEAQWEKAARGVDGRVYPWGNEMDENRGNLWSVKFATTVVGGFPGGASPFGALNMAGNVFEWTSDWYDEDYYHVDGNSTNPTGPAEGEARAIRGGLFRTTEKKENRNQFLWHADSESANQVLINFFSGYRMKWIPEKSNILIGFRCAAIDEP
jgi:formylglycine-generating enzyme required for sulfatase activity